MLVIFYVSIIWTFGWLSCSFCSYKAGLCQQVLGGHEEEVDLLGGAPKASPKKAALFEFISQGLLSYYEGTDRAPTPSLKDSASGATSSGSTPTDQGDDKAEVIAAPSLAPQI